jgi:hypothetical protein
VPDPVQPVRTNAAMKRAAEHVFRIHKWGESILF